MKSWNTIKGSRRVLMSLAVVTAFAGGMVVVEARGQQSDPATRQYGAAAALHNRGVYDLAADEWRRFLQAHGADARAARARHYLGVCQYQLGKFTEAVGAFQAVVADSKAEDLHPAAQLYLGMAHFALGKSGQTEAFDRAIVALNQLGSKHPKSPQIPEALYYRSESQYAKGAKAEAIRSYRQFLTRFPGHALAPDALYGLGVAQAESNAADDARQSFEQFLAKHAEHRLKPEVEMRLAEALLTSGKAAEAVGRFAAAAGNDRFPLADHAALRQADALVALKRYPEAAAQFAAFSQKYPKSQHLALAQLSAGRAYYWAADYAKARGVLEGVDRAGGSLSVEAGHWLAQTLLKLKDPPGALAAAERAGSAAGVAAGAAPWAAAILLDRADALYEMPKRRSEAASIYASVAAKYPDDASAPQALYMAALAAMEQGDGAAGLKHAQAFAERFGEHRLAPDAARIAAECLLQSGRHDDAGRRYAELIEKFQEHPDVERWKVRQALPLFLQKKYQATIDLLSGRVEQLRLPDAVAEARFLIGSSQIELQRYGDAVQSLGAAIAAQPQWRRVDETLLATALAYRRADDLAKARQTLSRLIAEHPESRVLDRAYYRLGEYSSAAGDPAAASDAYRRLLERWPGGELAPFATYEWGCVQLNRKEAAAAEATLGGLLHKKPPPPLERQARYARAMARHQQAKFAEAAEDLRAMLSAGATGVQASDARYLLALCLVESKQYDDAAASLRAVLRDDAGYAAADKVRYQLAWALQLAGKDDDAQKAFAELAAQHKESPLAIEATHNVAEHAFKNKQYEAASKEFYSVVERAGKSALGEKASHKLGWCYYHQGNFADAQKTFAYQLQQYPAGPLAGDAAFMDAECLFRQGQHAEAVARYRGLKNFSDKEFEMLALLHGGQAASQLKQWQQAADWLSQCAQKFPESPHLPEARYELGWSQQNLNKPDDAMANYRKVVGATDREVAARAQFMIGEIQFQKKEHAEAVKSFFKVAYTYPFAKWQADATYEAARCLEVLGKPSEAAKLYDELIKKYGSSDKVSLAKQRLNELQK